MPNYEYEEKTASSTIEELTQEAEEKSKRYELDKKRKSFNKALLDLRDKMCEFALLYGEEDYRTTMLTDLYDACLDMKDAIDMIQGVSVALDCITETMNIMDAFLDMNKEFEKASLKKKYGLFYKIGAWIRRKRANRNMNNRIKALTQRIEDTLGIASTITLSLKKSLAKMRVRINKQKEKNQKKLEKAGLVDGTATKSRAQTELEEMLKERRAEAGDDSTPTAPSTPEEPSAPSTKKDASGDSPDIGDIV